ncbi:MAG: GH3 auxin-responsive promoter family protein [Ruminococcus sp.]|nr:GH3 auxin-responsive promoter family protein [Ruminococcus sp.]
MKLYEKVINMLILNGLFAYGHFCKARYLFKSRRALSHSRNFLLKQLRCSKDTEYGRKYDFGKIHSIREYQKKVPLSSYEDYKPYIDRMVETGEQGLITGNKVDYFAKTSGTINVMKMIPLTRNSYMHSLRSGAVLFSNLHDEMKKKFKGIPYGRGMNMIECATDDTPSGIRTGYISGYVIGSALSFLPYITCLPREIFGTKEEVDMRYIKARYALQDRDMVYMMCVFLSSLTDIMSYIIENRGMLINDIQTGTIDRSVTMPESMRRKLERKLSPAPARAAEITKAFASGSTEGIIPKLWKRMTLIIGVGTGEFAPFGEKMRYYAGDKIKFNYELYASSECVIATTLKPEDTNYMLLPNSGFFEFIPEDGKCRRPLLMNEIEAGKHYELIVTNEAGLYRYRIKDIVKITGFIGKAPTLRYAYRKEQVINLAGMHMTTEHAAESIRLLEKKIGVQITDYSLYADNDHTPGRIMLFIETADELSNEVKVQLPEMFDSILSEVNVDYAHLHGECGDIADTAVYVMKKGSYQKIRDQKVKNGIPVNQIKALRVIRNREQLISLMKAM